MLSQFKDRVGSRRNKANDETVSAVSQHNRLSKPRTNKNSKSASPIVNNDTPFSDSPRYTDLNAKSRQQIRDAFSPISKEAGLGTWSDQDVFDTETVPEGRGRRSAAVSRSNSRTHSRSASALRSFVRSRRSSNATLKNPTESKVSLASTTQSDVEAAIRLLQEVKRNASPEELAALREALERPAESSAAIVQEEFDRSSPEISGVLSRRKSLSQAPGVATRTPIIDGQRRTWNSWKAPPIRPGDEHKWQAPKQGPSPLDRLVALDLADTTAAQTPGDLDYSPIVGYRPGSLMIVNGAPSPESTVDFAPANQRNDYFPTTEPAPSPLAGKNEKKSRKPRSMSAVGTRDIKPRKISDPAVEEKIPITYVKPDVQLKKRPQSIAVSTRRPSQNADTLAKDYQSYIPYSPFGDHKSFHGIWQEQEPETDELFLEDLTPLSQADSLVELSATITNVAELSPPSTASSENVLETPKKQTLRPSPRTSDSGYSSIASSGGSVEAVTNDEEQQHPRSLRVIIPPQARLAATKRPTVADLAALFEQSLLATVPRPAHGRTLSLDTTQAVVELPSVDLALPPSATQSASAKVPRQTRRLQKRRPSQPHVPIVQSAQSSRGVVPEVPEDVRAKFTRRLSVTPGMECLTRTYPSKDHINSAQSTTSFNTYEGISSPTQLEPDHAPARPSRGRRMSFFRRKSTTDKKDKDQEDPKVLDLGTIAVSLGASPYDPSMFGSFQPKETVENPTHPHQLGQTRSHSRSRSAMSMNSDTAAEYARMRSKDRALLPEPLALEMPHRKPRRMPKMEIGEAKQSKRRPQSFYFDEAPPMPTIDHAKYAAPLSAKPRLENAGTPTANQSRVRANIRPISPLRPNQTRPPSAHKNVDWEHKVDWEKHALQWSQRRKSIGEHLRPRPILEAHENVAPTPEPRARPMSFTPQELTTLGRYSGGLDYDHEGRGQIGGSAGTRQLHSYTAPKSMHFKQSYGVDLSDVPIFVQRQQ
ncbi:hypothetical protein E8E13_005842 [Curvularia kusanoi]|uniref:Uncharacterized protein n=1 Tax=Curvularia kusanoi TaxID=90978 RepID=A0A9P4TI29_CURKU|nr:hypothetical protein E8E13_005842 [Curvularia kusanoi]